MNRRILLAGLAFLSALLVRADSSPKSDGKPRLEKGSETHVVLKARLYEVDDAFYKKIEKARWLSRADLEELETRPAAKNAPAAVLEKQKPSFTGKEITLEPGNQGVLLTTIKPIRYLPTPEQLRRGKKGGQTIDVGFALGAQVGVTPDRRFVRAKFLERSLEIEGVEKVKVLVGLKETEDVGEIVFARESSSSWVRYIPDGGCILLPLRYRPGALIKNNRWYVAEIRPRIYIEEEERLRRGQAPG